MFGVLCALIRDTAVEMNRAAAGKSSTDFKPTDPFVFVPWLWEDQQRFKNRSQERSANKNREAAIAIIKGAFGSMMGKE